MAKAKVEEGKWTKTAAAATVAGLVVAVVGVYFAYKALHPSSRPSPSPGPTPSVFGSTTPPPLPTDRTYLSGLQPGSVNAGDFKTGAQQINGTTYPDSVRIACGSDWFVTYPARGYKTLTAVVGVPDDNTSVAAGATVTVTFTALIGTSAASSISVTPGHPQNVTVNLPGSVQGGESQIQIGCTVSPSLTDGVEVALGNAALSGS
jgi:hypothetical protein